MISCEFLMYSDCVRHCLKHKPKMAIDIKVKCDFKQDVLIDLPWETYTSVFLFFIFTLDFFFRLLLRWEENHLRRLSRQCQANGDSKCEKESHSTMGYYVTWWIINDWDRMKWRRSRCRYRAIVPHFVYISKSNERKKRTHFHANLYERAFVLVALRLFLYFFRAISCFSFFLISSSSSSSLYLLYMGHIYLNCFYRLFHVFG